MKIDIIMTRRVGDQLFEAGQQKTVDTGLGEQLKRQGIAVEHTPRRPIKKTARKSEINDA